MGKKLNQLTEEEAEQIYQRLKADEEPSKELTKYVHDELMREHHYMFQIKKGGKPPCIGYAGAIYGICRRVQ